MAKKRDFNKVGYPYKKEHADTFYSFCCQGLDFAQIAHEMQIPEEVLLRWAKDERKKEFGRAYDAGKTACEAYHSKLLDDMIRSGKSPQTTALQLKRLQTLFPDRWNIAQKQDVKIEDPYDKLSEEELDKRIGSLLRKDSMERRKAVVRSLKVVNRPGEDEPGPEDQDPQAS